MRSMTDALFSLESSACEAFVNKQHHVTVFFVTSWKWQRLHACCLNITNVGYPSQAYTSSSSFSLHRTLILSRLEYGCKICSSATEARLRVLDSVHYSGIRLATAAFRSSLIPSLLEDVRVLSLDLLCQSLVMRCWYRIHRLAESVTCTTVSHNACFFFFSVYDVCPSFPKLFGYLVRAAMT